MIIYARLFLAGCCCWPTPVVVGFTTTLPLTTTSRIANNIQSIPSFGRPRNQVAGSGLHASASANILFVDKNSTQEGPNGVQNECLTQEDQERALRFAGVGRLYATSSPTKKNKKNKNQPSPPPPSQQQPLHLQIVDRLASSTVIVVGLGGVGSWAAEALCRSGVGHLCLIDLDDICISNTNRQLHATSSSIGKMKLDEMKKRLLDINPQCNITLIHDFVSPNNVHDLLDVCCNVHNNMHHNNNTNIALLDAMDGATEKTALIAACVQRQIPIVTVGAAAGRKDPTQICVGDLTRVENDRLLASCRKNLRKSYGFEAGLSFKEWQSLNKPQKEPPHNNSMNNDDKPEEKKIKAPPNWKVQAIYSTEIPRAQCHPSPQQPQDTPTKSSFRLCDGPLGTACFVTGTYGFVAASCIVEMIAQQKMVIPRRQNVPPHQKQHDNS